MTRATAAVRLVAISSLGLLGACGGGGGGGGSGSGQSFGSSVALVDVTFLDPAHQSSGDDHRAPDNAALVQQIVFRFSDAVDPDDVNDDSIQVRNFTTREQASGTFTVEGRQVIFHAALPTRPIAALPGGQWDAGGAGLEPDTIYEVTVPLGGAASLRSLTRIEPEVFAAYDYEQLTLSGTIGRNFDTGTRAGTWSVRFRTTRKEALFLSGYDPEPPSLVGVSPLDGAQRQSPKLLTDPAQVFPPFSVYELVFDRALDPALDNVSDQTIELVDLASDMRLGVMVAIVENLPDRCEVQVTPSGILPFGKRLALRVPRAIRQISGGSSGGKGTFTATEFTVAKAPGQRVPDVMREPFADASRQETSRDVLGRDVVLADWDRNETNYLQAAFAFEGGGELGPLTPLAPSQGTRTITLDTNRQPLPLFDGSTPGAKPGTVVEGGVFNFTDIVIPDGIVLRGTGRNPLLLTATGSVMIAGVIDVSGVNGTDDVSYDSALTPTPGGLGGPGAGRGGVGHPTVVDTSGDVNGDGKPDGFSIFNFLPPKGGERGEGPLVENGVLTFARNGGFGGDSGIKKGKKLDCVPAQHSGNDNGSRAGGGGGGTFLLGGMAGKDGIGDMTSLEKWQDPPHEPIYVETQVVRGGQPGDATFVDDDPLNDFIARSGEVHTYMGGQGGGGGGSRLDSYFCGHYYGSSYPQTITDSKGGGGGGGGGALVVRALGPITFFAANGQILAEGGWGGGGEQIGCGNWGGGGGGGAGGLIVLESSTMVTLDDTNDDGISACDEFKCGKSCDIDLSVFGGHGGYPVSGTAVRSDCQKCNLKREHDAAGAGGPGGSGLVQIMVPVGLSPQIGAGVLIKPTDQPVLKLPATELSPISIAQSTWIDVGQVIQRSGSPAWSFRGTDPVTGYVLTDADGNVLDPDHNSIKVDMMPVLDPVTGTVIKPGKGDFIPPEGSVRVEFQAGDAVAPGSKEVADSSLSEWSRSIAVANGRQFMRYRITFNIADFEKHPGAQLSPDSRLSTVRFIKMPFDF